MIDRTKFKNIIKASILLMASLFLSISWRWFVDYEIDYTFPYADYSKGWEDVFFSFNPVKHRVVRLWVIIPYFVDSIMPIIYILAFIIVGRMDHPKIGSIWLYYALFQLLMSFDFLLSMKLFPFRNASITGMIFIQFYYIYWSYCQLTDNNR